jgi:hypothetical protein
LELCGHISLYLEGKKTCERRRKHFRGVAGKARCRRNNGYRQAPTASTFLELP